MKMLRGTPSSTSQNSEAKHPERLKDGGCAKSLARQPGAPRIARFLGLPGRLWNRNSGSDLFAGDRYGCTLVVIDRVPWLLHGVLTMVVQKNQATLAFADGLK